MSWGILPEVSGMFLVDRLLETIGPEEVIESEIVVNQKLLDKKKEIQGIRGIQDMIEVQDRTKAATLRVVGLTAVAIRTTTKTATALLPSIKVSAPVMTFMKIGNGWNDA
jgi:hypothetical protein